MSQIFSYQSRQVRTFTENNETWFSAKDVFSALTLPWNGAKTLASIPDSWQRVVKLPTLRNGLQSLIVISEPAVYKLAFRSNKPEADAFTNWVASEVLPSIRKTGRYEAKPKQLTLPAPALPRSRDKQAAMWELSLEIMHSVSLRKSQEIRAWIDAVENELSRVTVPLYKEVTRRLAEGSPVVSHDRGISALHEARIDAAEGVRTNLDKLVNGIWQAAWFATALRR